MPTYSLCTLKVQEKARNLMIEELRIKKHSEGERFSPVSHSVCTEPGSVRFTIRSRTRFKNRTPYGTPYLGKLRQSCTIFVRP